MAENSSIEWTTHTFNPVRGCTKVSPGCENCYAAREARRFPRIRGIWGNQGTRVVAVPSAWKEPLKWNRQEEALNQRFGSRTPGSRPRVFCASLADVFEDWEGELRFPADMAPAGWVTARWDGHQLVRDIEDSADRQGLEVATMDHLRQELFRLIDATPHLDWLLLTKRPENVLEMVPPHWREGFPPHVWMGTTCEDQKRADQRLPELLKIPARVRFLSCEPLLGPVEFSDVTHRADWVARLGKNALEGIHWVIAGGESGPQARPMHPAWARSLRDQCQAAGVPFFFKQWGEWQPVTPLYHDRDEDEEDGRGKLEILTHRGAIWDPERDGQPSDPQAWLFEKTGKKAAGRMLDGRTWDDVPTSKRWHPPTFKLHRRKRLYDTGKREGTQ